MEAVTSSNHTANIRNGNERRAVRDRLVMGIKRVRQQRQLPINRHSHRKVHRIHWMANYRQIRRWNQCPGPDRSKKRRNKFTMSMWLSTWWVKRGDKQFFFFFLCITFQILFEIQINDYDWPECLCRLKNHFLVLSIKFTENQNKRMPSQKYERHTQSHQMKWNWWRALLWHFWLKSTFSTVETIKSLKFFCCLLPKYRFQANQIFALLNDLAATASQCNAKHFWAFHRL